MLYDFAIATYMTIKYNHDRTGIHKCLIQSYPMKFPTRETVFHFFPNIFTCLRFLTRFLTRADPCCKHLPSKPDDHSMCGAFFHMMLRLHSRAWIDLLDSLIGLGGLLLLVSHLFAV
jgi:hypothetical protein